MGKFGTYLIIMFGLLLLFLFMGLLPLDKSNSPLVRLLLSPTDLQTSDLSVQTVLSIEGILAGVLIVGFGAAVNLELGVMVGVSIFLFNRIFDFIGVFSTVNQVNPILATLMFSPLLIALVVTVLEWWRGITT